MVTSDFKAEVEILQFRLFCPCTMHPAIIIGTVCFTELISNFKIYFKLKYFDLIQ